MSESNTPRELLKRAYHSTTSLLPVNAKTHLDFIRRQGYVPNLKNPQTFNEMLCFRKLSGELNQHAVWADKIESKRMVSQLFEGKYLIPSLYEGSFPTEGEYNALPAPFVLKASNASGANIFVWKESEKEYHSHYKSIINKRNAFLASTQEKFYHKLDDRFIIEPIFFNNSGSIPEDIKLHTFHGQVRFIQVDLDRFGNHSRNFYSPDWERQDFSFGYKQSEKDANKPVCLDEMVHISETIGRDHDYVRVDLYEYNEAPLFGELTFVHGEGYERFEPRSYDQLWGNLWRNEV